MRILRTYWYDGAVNGLPVPVQIAVGNLPRVKLRLGRINAGGQKGVDGLIILDLITPATNRAIDTAIVVSGDEDLREAAVHAQSFGVSVVLVGLPPTRQQRRILVARLAELTGLFPVKKQLLERARAATVEAAVAARGGVAAAD